MGGATVFGSPGPCPKREILTASLGPRFAGGLSKLLGKGKTVLDNIVQAKRKGDERFVILNQFDKVSEAATFAESRFVNDTWDHVRVVGRNGRVVTDRQEGGGTYECEWKR